MRLVTLILRSGILVGLSLMGAGMLTHTLLGFPSSPLIWMGMFSIVLTPSAALLVLSLSLLRSGERKLGLLALLTLAIMLISALVR